MKAIIDTNILVQYLIKTDKKSVENIINFINEYDQLVIKQSVFMESIFLLENKINLSRNIIDREIFCLINNPIFEFDLEFDIYLFLSLYTSYTSLDVIDIYLLIKSKNEKVLSLDIDLNKKINSIKI